jgi:DNA-binding Lrp family transcriptional regulator
MSSDSLNIDEYDHKILLLLQDNGRLTNQELSDLVGLSPSQCSRRRIGLELSNLILGYHARVSPQALKQEVMAMVEVKLISHEEDSTARFIAFVEGESAIIDAYKTTGDSDYVFKCVLADLISLNDLINRIFATRIINHIKTSVILDRVKESGKVTAR